MAKRKNGVGGGGRFHTVDKLYWGYSDKTVVGKGINYF